MNQLERFRPSKGVGLPRSVRLGPSPAIKRLSAGICAIFLGVLAGQADAFAAAPPVTLGVASAGDSITRAFNVDWCCFLSDAPQFSWSTGDDPTVTSVYQNLVGYDAGFMGHAYSFAVTGSRAVDLDAQLVQAAQTHVLLTTALIGGNDLCRASAADMTPTSTFASQVRLALSDFFAANPSGYLLLLSIPDLYQLWLTLHDDPTATSVWSLFGICPSMLSPSNSEADRQLVVAQEAADNRELAAACAVQPNCLWDRMSVFNTKFSAADASPVDYFHPSLSGQNHLAQVATAALVTATSVSPTAAGRAIAAVGVRH